MGKEKNREKNKLTVHHRIGVCNRKWANVDDKTNKMILSLFKHRALNTLVEDKQEPQKQLELMYNEYWKDTLSETAKGLFEALILMERDGFYKPELIKKKRK